MKVLISGASGLVGRALSAHLEAGGHAFTPLLRGDGPGIRWDPARREIGDVGGFDAVVHLAGENVAGGSWTDARKRRIRDSRVDGTRLLCEALAASGQPPRVLVSASAIGFYGSRGDEILTEDSDPGDGFLADVAVEWERAADPARDAGVRVVHPRIGVVLSSDGGALAKMLPAFRACVGGRVGSGRQWWSWIAIEDLVRAIEFALTHDDVSGPCNAVAPDPVTNAEFTRALARALGRPAVLPLPAFAARLLLGREMADALLLASTRVAPAVLTRAGFVFDWTLDGWLAENFGQASR